MERLEKEELSAKLLEGNLFARYVCILSRHLVTSGKKATIAQSSVLSYWRLKWNVVCGTAIVRKGKND